MRVAWCDSSRLAIITLVAANLAPLVAVLMGSWTLFSVMFLYWAENGVVGLFNVPKMLLARPSGAGRSRGAANKLFVVPFFLFHYGIFWFVHGVFVFVLFGEGGLRGFRMTPIGLMAQIPPGLWGALGFLFLSHGLSFVNNYIGRREYETINVEEQMMQPYTRVMILHMVVLVGGFVVMLLGQPLIALVLLIVLKTWFDLRAHLREHGRIEQAQPPRTMIERG